MRDELSEARRFDREPTVDELFAAVTRKQTEARHAFEKCSRNAEAQIAAIHSLFQTQAQLTMLLVKIERRTRRTI